MKAALVAFLAAGGTSAFGQLYPGPSPAASDAERLQRMLQLFGGRTGKWDEHIKWMGRNRMCGLAGAGWRGAAAERILGIFQTAAFLNPPHGFELQTTVTGIGRGPLDFLTDDSDATGSHPGAFRVSGVSVTDPTTLLAVAAMLGLTALVAAFVPAVRAFRVDPMQALRCE